MGSIIIKGENNYKELKEYFKNNNINNFFLVVYDYEYEPFLVKYLKENYKVTIFRDFTPNPKYEEVEKGIDCFIDSNSKVIMAIGGGSCIDVAKCIKAFCTMDKSINYLDQTIKDNDITLIVCPTTAGTGSEQTKYSVIYYNNQKQSITSESIIPKVVFFDSSFLKTLPIYQKKATLLDTLSHSIESFWSINRNEESIEYSKKAINLVLYNMNNYLNNDDSTYDEMFLASFYAGRAINITQTTAGHALAYKITSLYHIPHGLATMLINSVLLPYMINNSNDENLIEIFNDLSSVLHLSNLDELKTFLKDLLIKLELFKLDYNKKDIDELVNNVNVDRLKNNPYKLNKEDIKKIYTILFKEIEGER